MLQSLLARALSPPVVRAAIYLTATKFTAGSLVIWIDGGRVLLVRTQYGERSWGFPGGVMKRHEDPVECAARELREETGVAVTVDDLTLVGCHTQRHARHIDHLYALTGPPVDDGVGDGSDRFEIAEVRWWPLDDLPVLRREARYVIERYSDVIRP